MTIIQGICATIGEVREWFEPVYQKRRLDGRGRKTICVSLIACASIGFGLPMTAWTADLSSLVSVKPRKIVTSGVGYEYADTSVITVKTYDAENGEILSDETYELNVREDAASASSQPRERIFAGGVGSGADGLSAFTLRVYDAATGQFLWEGLLNLNVGNQEADSTRRVTAHLNAPQARVTQVRSSSAIDGQPQFSLRAVDLITGQLVWTDHFTAGAGSLARAERISRPVVDQTEEASVLSQQIEFRIRMMDDRHRKVLWEDTIEPAVDEMDLADSHDAAAENLPVWRSEEFSEMRREAI